MVQGLIFVRKLVKKDNCEGILAWEDLKWHRLFGHLNRAIITHIKKLSG
jgi:hypothetical protein